jgi:pantoate--beta-alanine ligase
VSPRLVSALTEYRSVCAELRAGGHRVALVPTLGALHHGHQALMRAAREAGDRVVVSIFVNPTQFGPGEDFERYPRDLSGDLAVCAEAGAHVVFAPERHEIYPVGEATRVSVSGLTEAWCGASRPGHFEGVATVVTKLLAATGPCAAVFGRKDYQQLQVVKRLVLDLLLPVRVVDHPTVRDADGLATSSRNRYLSPSERERALALPRALAAVSRHFSQGERDAGQLQALVTRELSMADLDIEYAALVGSSDLRLVSRGQVGPGEVSVLVAARVGTTRLIDNITLGVDSPPTLSAEPALSEEAS